MNGRRSPSRTLCLLAFSISMSYPVASVAATEAGGLGAAELWHTWPEARFVRESAPCFGPEALAEQLRALALRHPSIDLSEVGRSVEGRPIHLMRIGRGATKVLLWSQMHGDEPSATPALLDLTDFLLRRENDPMVTRLLDRLTLLMVPMLNPDGAEAYRRRNAQGIDINRDALNLATPEGRLLKGLRETYQPALGFNLHDQNRRRTAGDTGVLASISVLAVVGDAAKTVTPERILSLKASVAIAETLDPFIPGGVGRFDDSWSERSFGDNLTAWGTPVVLIESGGVAPGEPLDKLTRLNFVALGTVLSELAGNRLADRDPARYETIPENNSDVWSDVVLRGGRAVQPGVAEPYRADLAFDRPLRDRERSGCAPTGVPRSEVSELGDARIFAAGEEIDARGKILVPPFTVGAAGVGAMKWLNSVALDRLADLGVAAIAWSVQERDVGRALTFAREARDRGGPRIELVGDDSELPEVVLQKIPELPGEGSLAAAVAALERAGAALPMATSFTARLERLWHGNRLRFEGPASFLLVDAGEWTAKADELGPAPIASVYLDGVKLLGGTR